MMKRQLRELSRRNLLRKTVFAVVLTLFSFSGNLMAQNTVFSYLFTNNVTPPVPHPGWQAFLTALQPGQYIKMTLSGTYDMTGITCTDPVIVNAYANALKNHLDYTSASTGGHVWSLCNRYGGEVWLDPPAQCSGSNCPSPAYIIRAEIGNLNWGGVNTATCTSNPTQTITFTFFKPSSPNDAGVSAITSPLNFCAGTYPIIVQLENFGTQQITAAKIKWTLNGAPQPDYNWTGLLDTLTSTTRKTLVTLNPAYNFASGVPYTIKAWSSIPNNVADTVNRNDTTTATRQAAIAGTFTIGGASPTYPNFAAAVAALNANGICGPVVFNVRSGSYSEQVNINAVSGASATNTITFQSETGNRADVTLTYSASTTGAGSATVNMNGTDYVTFQNMTIVATGASYGYTVYMAGGCDYNKFINCNIRTVNSTSSYHACIYSPSGSVDNYN